MVRACRWSGSVLALGILLSIFLEPISGQENERRFQNLQVLPPDISNDSLSEIMLDNLRGLGLRRLEGRGCLFCHVGNMDQPRSSWDYASDEKPMKEKARIMMAMVQNINANSLASLPDRLDSQMQVSCYTCHAGRTDPRPLTTILAEAYRASGIDSLTAAYDVLRARYFGGDAYDFRVNVLSNFAYALTDRGEIHSGIAVARLNVDANTNDPEAVRDWLGLVLEETTVNRGVEAAIQTLDAEIMNLEPGVFNLSVLDGLAWRLYRSDHQVEAFALLEENHTRFPEEYIPKESLAFVHWENGRKELAYSILDNWLASHPGHDRARRLLVNLKAR